MNEIVSIVAVQVNKTDANRLKEPIQFAVSSRDAFFKEMENCLNQVYNPKEQTDYCTLINQADGSIKLGFYYRPQYYIFRFKRSNEKALSTRDLNAILLFILRDNKINFFKDSYCSFNIYLN